jgi:hypothetical protein
VHEKSILIAAVPVAMFLAGFPDCHRRYTPLACVWMLTVTTASMFPLLQKESILRTSISAAEQLIAWRVFKIKIILLCCKNALAYCNAGVVAANSKVAGFFDLMVLKNHKFENFPLTAIYFCFFRERFLMILSFAHSLDKLMMIMPFNFFQFQFSIDLHIHWIN